MLWIIANPHHKLPESDVIYCSLYPTSSPQKSINFSNDPWTKYGNFLTPWAVNVWYACLINDSSYLSVNVLRERPSIWFDFQSLLGSLQSSICQRLECIESKLQAVEATCKAFGRKLDSLVPSVKSQSPIQVPMVAGSPQGATQTWNKVRWWASLSPCGGGGHSSHLRFDPSSPARSSGQRNDNTVNANE